MRFLLFAFPLILMISARGEGLSRPAMLRDLAAKVIAPAYQDLAAKSLALANAVEALARDPDRKALEQARQAWLTALLAARTLQAFQLGPVVEREYASVFYYWQVLPVRIEAVLESSRAFDKSLVDELGATSKGFFALEYLLFGRTNAEPAVDALTSLAASERRRVYTLALARDIESKARQLATDWKRADPDGAAAKFVSAGQDTINALVNQLAMTIETIAENRINFVLSLPQPVSRQFDRIEASHSGSSLQGVLAMLEGVRRIYQGGEGTGLDDALRALNAALEKRVREQFDAALAAIQAVGAPLETAVVQHRAALEKAYEATRSLEILFKVDLPSALGVTITFNSTDGD